MVEAISHNRGHEIRWVEKRQRWIYCDNGDTVVLGKNRACARCHEVPLPHKATTGYGLDACLGLIPGLWAACCGHGVRDGYATIKQGEFTWDIALPKDSTPEQRHKLICQFLNYQGPGENAEGELVDENVKCI